MPYSTIHMIALVEAVQRTGVDVSGRIAAALPSVDGADALRNVDATEFEDLLQLCLAESNHPALGLAMGEQASLVSLGLTEGLGSRVASLRMLIEMFNARFAVLIDEEPPRLSLADDEAVLSFPVHGSTEATQRLRAEYGVTLGLLLLRAWAGPFATPLWISFPHAAPSYAGEYRRLFGGLTRFGTERAAIGLNPELLSAPAYRWGRQLFQPTSTTSGVGETRVDAAERVGKFLASCTGSKRLDMAEIATHLGMLERTLRRRLASEGVRFRELSDDARRTRALSIALDRTHSPATAADALGFSNVSGFCRAFKRWTGFSLSEYRALHLRDNAGSDAAASEGYQADPGAARLVGNLGA